MKISSARDGRNTSPFSTMTLALWQLRQTWGLLLITGLGLVAAIAIMCAVPLYSQIATEAGLRNVLTASPDSAAITFHAESLALSQRIVQDIGHTFTTFFQDSGSAYLHGASSLSIHTQDLAITSPLRTPGSKGDQLQLFTAPINQTAQHVTLQQGRLPSSGNPLEIALPPDEAKSLHVGVGSTITVQLAVAAQESSALQGIVIEEPLPIHVVGLFIPTTNTDPFWHGESFSSTPLGYNKQWIRIEALTSTEAFFATIDHLAAQYHSSQLFFANSPDLFLTYSLDPAHIGVNQLDDVLNRLTAVQGRVNANYNSPQSTPPYPYIQQADVSGVVLGTVDTPGSLEQYKNRIFVIQIPVGILLAQIVALILFFVVIMMDLLVERQQDTLALLRSRGASPRQIFGALLTQGIGLCLLALSIGILLALALVYILARITLAPEQQTLALNIVFSNQAAVAQQISLFALLAIVAAISTIALALGRALQRDILTTRRQAARSTTRQLWQRLNLDLVAIIIALAVYVFSLYVANAGVLDARIQTLIASPLALVAPIFLVIAGILLLLRILPLLLQGGAQLAIRNPGAVPMLALAQVARAPQRIVRIILLLVLATSFTIFTLVFTASQTQHILDTAAYETGADFAGTTTGINSANQNTLAKYTGAYQHIPGVLSASLGYSGEATSANTDNPLSVQIMAVDADTFAQTALWTSQDSNQPLSSLMAQLAGQRDQTVNVDAVSAIIDASAGQQLALSVGSGFQLQLRGGLIIHFIVAAKVQHIPTTNDSTLATTTGSFTPPMAIIVDYASLAKMYTYQVTQTQGPPPLHKPLPPTYVLSTNYVYLRTNSDAETVATLRDILSKGPLHLDNLQDRRALVAAMHIDPLYLDLVGILTIGAVTALLLALIGSLTASWLSAQARLTNFAILRALGTDPPQVAGVLAWEQGIIYIAAMILGLASGALLSATVVPSLIFTNLPPGSYNNNASGDAFYVLQHILPPAIVPPLSLWIILLVLVALCIVALGMMVRIVSQPAMSQVLRLNED